jgi:hypothetical protein
MMERDLQEAVSPELWMNKLKGHLQKVTNASGNMTTWK